MDDDATGMRNHAGSCRRSARRNLRDSSLSTTGPSEVVARAPRRNGPPHPPFGHLLPGGEKGMVCDSAERDDRGGGNKRSPSPLGERAGVRGLGR